MELDCLGASDVCVFDIQVTEQNRVNVLVG